MKAANSIAINGETVRVVNFNSKLKHRNYTYEYGEKVQLHRLKKKKINVIIEGEELYIFELTLSLASIIKLKSIVEGKLKEKFFNRDSILFDYKIIERSFKNIKILVYCINGETLPILQDSFPNKINSIDVLQLKYSDMFRRRLKKKNFILLMKKNHNLYLILVKNKLLISNKVFSTGDCLWKKKVLEYMEDLERIRYIHSPIYVSRDDSEEIEVIKELRDKYEICILS